MGEAVEQGRGHLCVSKDGGPFAEAEVGGDHDAGAFVELAEQVEQQRPARGAERQVSEFVQDDEVEFGQVFGDLACFAFGLFLLEGIDQFNGREEAGFAAMMLDCLDAKGCGDMGFAGARAASQDHVLGSIQELTAMQGPDGGLVDLAGGKVKPREVLVG